ncbi:MAG: hypothetical protein ABSE71_02110 [Candidatus Micrarchaeaceae archaeon]|jgi:hypothetical protein
MTTMTKKSGAGTNAPEKETERISTVERTPRKFNGKTVSHW